MKEDIKIDVKATKAMIPKAKREEAKMQYARRCQDVLKSKQFICNVHGEVLEECFNRFEKKKSLKDAKHIHIF